MGKKPIVKLRVFRGTELNYNAEGKVKNENHLVSLPHNSISWGLFLKNLKISGYCKVEVESVKTLDKGVYIDVKDDKAIRLEVEEAFSDGKEVVLTPEQKKIAELEAKLELLLNNKKEVKKEVVETELSELDLLRAEYKEKVGKNAFNGWDLETLKGKLETELAKK